MMGRLAKAARLASALTAAQQGCPTSANAAWLAAAQLKATHLAARQHSSRLSAPRPRPRPCSA
eukprot:901195-Pyramimonas_sp.AAC.1